MVIYIDAIGYCGQPTKSVSPVSTRYEDMKGDAKCRKWGRFG